MANAATVEITAQNFKQVVERDDEKEAASEPELSPSPVIGNA